METLVPLIVALAVFTVGMSLSFFFSGTETAFYRVNALRLMIGANAGDRISRRLLQYTTRPGRFVSTTLVGNNVANYLVSLGTGLLMALFLGAGGLQEVLATWMITPVVFVFGELLPKNISYASPSWLLRKGSGLFLFFYWLFAPIALPLALFSKALERFADQATGTIDFVLGRNRLTQLFSQGHQAGLLTDAQGRFLAGLLSASGNPVVEAMVPIERVRGLEGSGLTRGMVLEHARRFGLGEVVLSAEGHPGEWTHYLRTSECAILTRPLEEIRRELPRFPGERAQLEVLLDLRERGNSLGAIVSGNRVIGLVHERGLVEALFRAGRPIVLATSGPPPA